MDRGFSDDGNISDLPWTAVFDPVANARALSAIQAEGFRAAARLVDRFVASTPGSGDGTSARDGPTSEADPIVSTWWSVWGRLLRSMPGAPVGAAGLHMDLASENGNGAVALNADAAGSVSTEVWLHNNSTDDMGEIRLLCGGLLSHDGRAIDSEAVRFTPACAAMPARSSRGVTVEVIVAEGLPSGCYRGTVLVHGRPELWMPIVLTLRAPA